jgi:hypothetical protein
VSGMLHLIAGATYTSVTLNPSLQIKVPFLSRQTLSSTVQ